MSATLRALSQKDWGQIRECLDEMKSLKTLTLFFSYHWEYIVPNRVDDLIKLDQRWEEVVKEKLPRLHQRGMIQFESSIKHHIHRFKS